MILIDTNVLLDISTADPRWRAWSVAQIDRVRETDEAAINPVIYAELCVRAAAASDVEALLARLELRLAEPSRGALFLAGKAFGRYRDRGGQRLGVLPDFFVGAQAADESWPVLTRDPRRIAKYFPQVTLIAP